MKLDFIYRGHRVQLFRTAMDEYFAVIDGDREDDIIFLPLDQAVLAAKKLIDSGENLLADQPKPNQITPPQQKKEQLDSPFE